MLESRITDSIIMTPVKVANEMVNILPDDVWNKDTKFLNPCCKSGVFLSLIYGKLMDKLSGDITDERERREHILNNQLYGIGMSDFCTAVAQRGLYGEMDDTRNIKCIDNYTDIVKAGVVKYNAELREVFGDVKFDVVIGNPPYNRGMDLDFVYKGFQLSTKYCVMITPAKWQTAAANQRVASKMNYGEFREKLVPHIRGVVFYPDAFDCFNIKQLDGITYYIMSKDTKITPTIKNKCGRQNIFNSEQTRDISNGETLNNIGNDIVKFLEAKVKLGYSFNRNNTLPAVYVSDAMCNPGENIVSLSGDTLMFSPMQIIKKEIELKQLPTYNQQLFNGTIPECESFISWINTKLVRFLVLINVSVYRPMYTDNYFRFVPAPPSGKFDHIYTDEELYKAFNLPQKYIDVIEAVIKERT